MSITVYIPNKTVSPTLNYTRNHSTPFEMAGENFIMVNNHDESLVIPTLPSKIEEVKNIVSFLGEDIREKIILIMYHTHIANDDFFEHSTQGLINEWLKYSDRVAIVDLNYKTTRDIFYDFCWNRQKSYFVDYNIHDLHDRLWTGNATEKMFTLGEIIKRGPYKKFIVPNRVHAGREGEHRNKMRQKLHDFVPDRYCHRGHPEAGYILYPQEVTNDTLAAVRYTFGGWSPISDDYYQTSFVSLYVETITSANNIGCITEKTYDPLIKGHFILPYGYKGMIAHIKDLGFILPKWIDYSYDLIDDAEERFEAYLTSITKLNELDEFDLLNLFNKDKWILIANRNLFFIKPYDNLSEKIVSRFSL